MDVDRPRERRKQDYIFEGKQHAEPQISVEELDPWTAWAYRPRTVSLLLIGACLLVWVSGALNPDSNASTDSVTAAKRGVWALILVFLAYCLLQAPSTILIRPHPAVWRLVHGLAVVYLVALTFLLFQNTDLNVIVLKQEDYDVFSFHKSLAGCSYKEASGSEKKAKGWG